MGLLGILAGLAVLVALACRGWSVLLLAPAAALIAAAFAGEPLLAHWAETFMNSAARFVAQFFPLFLLGALFGKLMEDTGAVGTIARRMTATLGPKRAMLPRIDAAFLAEPRRGGTTLALVVVIALGSLVGSF